jgi:zeaxanthin glucosyltransferase
MTALFVLLPYPSHYMASFGFARLWQQRGYQVVFTGMSIHKELVEKEGFMFSELYYASEIRVRKLRVLLGLWLRSVLDDSDLRNRYRVFYAAVQAVRIVVVKYSPNIIFLDEHLSYYAVYLAPCSTPIIMLNTKLSTRKKVGIPPLSSTYLPTHSILSILWCEWLWGIHLAKRPFRQLFQDIAFCGKEGAFFQKRLAQQIGINTDYFFDKKNAFYDRLYNVSTIILAPAQLEFKRASKAQNEYYCNPKFERDETPFLTEDYLTLRDKLQHRQQAEGVRVIYAAFGTLSHTVPEKMNPFLLNLVKAVTNHLDWHLVVSTTGLSLGILPAANVSMLPYVPQLDMLTWANAMVTHGGLTTVKECLFSRVPMLIYPFHAKTDMPGNGARITQHGWGLQGDMRRDDPVDIARKLNKVLTLNLPVIEPDEALPNGLLTTLFPNLLDLAESK